MDVDNEKAAGVTQTPAADNVLLFKKRDDSVGDTGATGNPAAFDPESPASLLRHAWALLPIVGRDKPLTKFVMNCADTQSERRHFAELMPDLRMRIVEVYSGRVVAESAPILPAGAPR